MSILRKKRNKKRHKKKSKGTDKRLIFLAVIIFLVAASIIGRLFQMQVMEGFFYKAMASDQHEIYKELMPERGKIFMRDSRKGQKDLFPLATNKYFYLMYSQPKDIIDPEEIADSLVDFLYKYDPHLVYSDIDPEEEKEQYEATVKANNIIAKEEFKKELVKKFSKKDDPYEPLKKGLTEEEMNSVRELGLPGIYFIKQTGRYYPENNIGSHIAGFLGFVGEERLGQYGVEGYFNKELSGDMGFLKSERDALGRWIALSQKELTPASNGSDVVLTVDNTLEYFTCNKLNESALRHGADSGSVIIMEVKTGAILAMCSYPDFDPNNYSDVDGVDVFNNQSIFSAYEPGSIFKTITMASAIDQGKVSPNTVYTDKGFVEIDNHIIKNADEKVYGESSMIEVLKESINTGTIFISKQLGLKMFKKYVEDFGFGILTGIRLDKEVAGNIRSLDKKGEIYMATASFGQGITVTPLQMAAAYNAIANKGKFMAPYIVDKIIKNNGQEIKTKPQTLRQVVSERAAALTSGMLVSVISEGHASRAGVPGYYLAGKTGTAQVAEEGIGKYGDKTIHSFVGFGPVDNPKFTIMVRLDDPKDVRFSSSSAAPLFGEIARFVLNYYEIAPDEK